MIKELLWNEGGYGLGICAVASSLAWSMRSPNSRDEDLKSIVAVSGPPEKYTDEELALLLDFSKKRTAEYDRVWKQRMGANLILFDKRDGQWLRKRLTWETGPMWSPDLADAIATMTIH